MKRCDRKKIQILVILCVIGHSGDAAVVPSQAAEVLAGAARTFEGRAQSPIDLKAAYELDIVNIGFQYTPSPCTITNTGHTTQVSTQNECAIIVDNDKYILNQFHFHTPSEHYIEGVQYQMEIHFVHKNTQGNLAVIGVLVKEGQQNMAFEPIITNIPAEVGQTNTVRQDIDFLAFFPTNKIIYRYNGSLTTPPFTEGVKWVVMRDVIELSKDQIDSIHKIMGKNNRPLQKLNNRPIVEGIR